jgi:diaminopimelate decarboxylase
VVEGMACFVTEENANELRSQFGSPIFVYDETTLLKQASCALQFPANHGLTVRYAMKACPNAAILQARERFIPFR